MGNGKPRPETFGSLALAAIGVALLAFVIAGFAVFVSYQNGSGFKTMTQVSNFPAIQSVDIKGPETAFGSLLTESYSPIFQTDAVYGLNSGQTLETVVLSGSATADDSSFILSTGTTPLSFATIQSRKRLRYRSGQGSRIMFSALFGEPVANSIQVAGMGSSTDGVFFGYDMTGTFGILYSSRGVRETQTLTVTVASSTAENVVVTLDDVPHNIAVTASGNIQRTVYEISQGSYPGWSTETLGATIIFVRGESGPTVGSYSLAGTTAVGTFAQTNAGVVPVNTWIAQSEWNGERLDGTNPNELVLNPRNYNIYQISMQYLGAGAVRFYVEGTSEFVLVHTQRFQNTRTETTFKIPSFPFTAAAYSAGSSDDITMKIGSFGGFIEGNRAFTGDRFAINNVLNSVVDNAAYYALFTIQNSIYYKGKASQGIVNVMSVGGAASSSGSITLYVFRTNRQDVHNLQGNPDFQPFAPNSAILVDMSATTLTVTDNSQLIWSADVAFLSSADSIFGTSVFEELTLQPGEYLSVCARTSTGTATYVSANIDVRQDY